MKGNKKKKGTMPQKQPPFSMEYISTQPTCDEDLKKKTKKNWEGEKGRNPPRSPTAKGKIKKGGG